MIVLVESPPRRPPPHGRNKSWPSISSPTSTCTTSRPTPITYLVRGGEVEVLEGDWQPKRFFIIRFEDREKAMTWYYSQPYREVMKLRLASSTSNLLIVAGDSVFDC
ncbi:MAG: DUF1330 domain-containing protein [Chloroflexi bacterium]|nr:MAG: DUF1330 domain-containing protein [Chloroflexota bacterium]